MRKSSSSSRIRRKSSPPAPATRQCNDQDPFHNGQTPACRLLLHAIQDVFPELQQQMKHQTPSSNLGQLLRWQFLKNRKARMLPPAPPLSTGTSPSTATAASKKKRKRKKKKKQDTTSTCSTSTKEEAESAEINNTSNTNTNELDQSVRSLDESVDRLEEKMLEATAEPPSLEALPFDDKEGREEGGSSNKLHASSKFFEQVQPQEPQKTPEEKLHSSSTFFAQIQPQPPEDSAISTIPPPPKETEPPTSPITTKTLIDASTVTPTKPQNMTLDPPVSHSPNHEWVPEEGATSQKETPPGDAIKDPLELPFLLRLDSAENSLTTTTIEGSLISAEAVNEESSSLETTRALFEEWLEQLDHEQTDDRKRDYQSFLEFLQARLRKGSQSLGIPLQDLKDSCAWIECSTCLQEALAEVDKLQERTEENPVVLNPSCLQDQNAAGQEMTVEAAFDYVALEEGNHRPAHVEEEEPDLDTCLSFVISEPKQKKNVTKQLFFEAWTQKHLDTLVEQWLPCGIEEDVMVTTAVNQDSDKDSKVSTNEAAIVLKNDEFRAIQQNVLENEKDVRDSLDELQSLGNDLRREMTNISSSFGSSQHVPNLEFKAFPMLKDCDKMCTSYMSKLLEVLRLTTNERSSDLADLQLHLWTAYLGALNRTLKASDSYYTKVMEQMADQRGVVPKMFISAPLRTIFQTLVEEKVSAWTDLGNIFSNHLTSRVLKEWYTRSVWQDCRTKNQPEEDSKMLDDNCHDLIKELSKWTDTILGGRVAEIQRQLMTQTEHVLELLQSIVEPLAKEYATVERYFCADRNRYFASLRSNILLAHGVKKRMRLIDQTEVECMSTGTILVWRQMRIMQSRMVTSFEIPSLPLQVKRWMLQDERRFDEWRLGTPSSSTTSGGHHQMYCKGLNGGKRRVMCVLAGLVYRWLEDRCMEWKAELAEKELLTDFGTAKSISASTQSASGQCNNANKASKSGKRNKKKKNKAASSPVDLSEDTKNDDSKPPSQHRENGAQVNGTHEEKPAPRKEGVINQTLVDEKGKQISSLSNLDAEKEVAVKENISNGQNQIVPESAQKIESDEASWLENIQAPEVMAGEKEECDIDDYPSSVYVEDEKEMLSARDFLVGRLLELLKSNDKNEVILSSSK